MQNKINKRNRRIQEKAKKRITKFMSYLDLAKKDLDNIQIIKAIVNLRVITNRNSRDQEENGKSKKKGGGLLKDLILVNQYFNVP